MVAGTNDCCITTIRNHSCCWWRIGHSSVYLHTLLIFCYTGLGNFGQTGMLFSHKTMHKRVSELDMYKANLAISTGFLALYFLFGRQEWLLYVALGVGALTLLLPALARWVSFGWFKLAEGLGYINSRILLSLVFFAFLFPIALLYRLSNRNPLALRHGRRATSLFTERNHTYSAKDLDNIW